MANQTHLETELHEIHDIHTQHDETINKEVELETKKLSNSTATSYSERKSANSLQTILSVSNTLIGSSTMVLPVLFRDVGIGTATIISIGIALISLKTSLILIIHNKVTEQDLPDTILRILGNKWRVIYNVSNIILLWACGMIYQILICSLIYPVLCLVFDNFNIPYSRQNEIIFSKMSYQWVGVIYFFMSMPLFFQRNLSFILKLVPFGSISIVCFFFFLLFKGSVNLGSQDFGLLSQMTWFTGEISEIAGVFTLAFMIQSLLIPIAKNNKNQNNNKRDISIAFIWTWFLYEMVGVFGAISIQGIFPRNGTQGSTVLEYFSIDWMIHQKQQRFCFFYNQALQIQSNNLYLVFNTQTQSNWIYYGFSVFYSITCLIVQICGVELSVMLSLSGALIGLFQIYIIPIVLHLSCLYINKIKVKDEATRVSINQQSNISTTSMQKEIEKSHANISYFSLDHHIDVSCNDHSEIIKEISKTTRLIVYGSLIAIGSYVALTTVISTFT